MTNGRKIETVNAWESVDQDHLAYLFRDYLYPVSQWWRGKRGLGYNASKIDTFKGIKSNVVFNYALFQKASHLFVEHFNRENYSEILPGRELNQFQLSQPIIAGQRFFAYTAHYDTLLSEVRSRISRLRIYDRLPNRGAGDRYIRQLFECSLLFFADRFGIAYLTESTIMILMKWAYSIRMVMTAVYPQTINKYALGSHPRLNQGLNLFEEINNFQSPDDLKLLSLQSVKLSDSAKEKYSDFWKELTDEK